MKRMMWKALMWIMYFVWRLLHATTGFVAGLIAYALAWNPEYWLSGFAIIVFALGCIIASVHVGETKHSKKTFTRVLTRVFRELVSLSMLVLAGAFIGFGAHLSSEIFDWDWGFTFTTSWGRGWFFYTPCKIFTHS
jgi:hypothetical protein